MNELQAIEKAVVNAVAKDTKEEQEVQPFEFLPKPVVKKDSRTDAQRRYEKPTLDISLPHVCLLSLQPSKLITVKHHILLST